MRHLGGKLRELRFGLGGEAVRIPYWLALGRRIELGLSQAERAGMTQPQVSRMEGGDAVATLPLLRRLAKALDGVLNVAIDEGDSRVTFTPHAA
ncbi:helix-turn-helix domain-containing protein [Nonomuraea glycinis]|uniref:helix-turn-helix domain-containing protein n=1 Tax=Nonomuraea glycinis TaxID=2047744 RepID=UPI002E118CBA|nr:helix-turn-helix transcriptional regulator [Nonomuraea glycinis]